MKKGVLVLGLILIVFLGISVFGLFENLSYKITGYATEEPPANAGEVHTIGPSEEEQSCVKKCYTEAGCELTINDCTTANKDKCLTQCNAVEPEVTEETSCMEECVLVGCEAIDFTCQGKNQAKCEEECDMIRAPDESEMSAEQLCITQCVNAESPGTICGASQTGETGNELCQRCATSCVNLYEGPCLDDAKLKAKQKECEICEHCYGEPVMGDSGEGWECIVEVECKDASSEFGDNPGVGPSTVIDVKDVVSNIGEAIGNAFEAVGNFVQEIFTGESPSASSGGESPTQ